ncbi:MAG: YicC/YloC family endoribonuclease [Rikenellaceae bacterium]
MIKSMTGFGKAEAQIDDKRVTVEIKSLNSKQLDLSVRIPSLFRAAESQIRAMMSSGVMRGKCELSISFSSTAQATPAHINPEMFAIYAQQLRSACEGANLDYSTSEMVASILRLPEVVSSKEESLSERSCEELLAVVSKALLSFNEFRAQEGATLISDLLRRVDKIEELMNSVTPFEQARVESVKQRIIANIAKLKVDVDSNRLEAEMIFYAEKLDITEEKVRLANHCKYFREVAAGEDNVGRKLGFISQEMGREINTMGSKANEANIQRIVVEMKDELEKIKEQLLNIL